MDSTLAAFISIASSVAAALFGALSLSIRQQREDLKGWAAEWKTLYEKEAAAHQTTRDKATENQYENSAALREVAAFLHTTAERRRLEQDDRDIARRRERDAR